MGRARKKLDIDKPLIRKEAFYQKRFLDTKKPDFFSGSVFHREVPLSYGGQAKGTNEMPNASLDFVEVDRDGQLHLWEVKLLHSYESKSGRVVGQMSGER